MIEQYIDSERDDMYESWDERALDCIDEGAIEAIQRQLEEMFASIKGYWTFGKGVEIDIFPQRAMQKALLLILKELDHINS